MICHNFSFGQGLGNQLFCYISTRAIAKLNGYEFGFTGLENLGDRRYNDKGLYFMDLDLGVEVKDIKYKYTEKEKRIITNFSHHDATIGCDIRLSDRDLMEVKDFTEISGLMQGEDYFYDYIDYIKHDWLKIKPEFDDKSFSSDDICILNIRDYEGNNELFLQRNYWVMAIYHMLNLNPNMKFLVITENPEMAKRLLPELSDNIYHFDVGRDYAIIKNAKWLILSNSSFAYFPAVCSDAHFIIAPKYWARHNVSNGYWSCGYNLYQSFTYMDREGKLQSYNECKREFLNYRKETNIYGTESL